MVVIPGEREARGKGTQVTWRGSFPVTWVPFPSPGTSPGSAGDDSFVLGEANDK